LAAALALALSGGVAQGAQLVPVPGGASSFGIDPIRGTVYVANRGGIFTLDSSASRLVSVFALGRFDTIGDVVPTTGLVAVYAFGGGPELGIFNPLTGGVASLAHSLNPPRGAIFAGELLYVPIFECFGFTCGPKLETLSFINPARKPCTGRATVTPEGGGRLLTVSLASGRIRGRTGLSRRFGAVQAMAVTAEGRILVGTNRGVVVVASDR
jgi:hypothetical protein